METHAEARSGFRLGSRRKVATYGTPPRPPRPSRVILVACARPSPPAAPASARPRPPRPPGPLALPPARAHPVGPHRVPPRRRLVAHRAPFRPLGWGRLEAPWSHDRPRRAISPLAASGSWHGVAGRQATRSLAGRSAACRTVLAGWLALRSLPATAQATPRGTSGTCRSFRAPPPRRAGGRGYLGSEWPGRR